jgi:putative CocE/NonD family hydrolase
VVHLWVTSSAEDGDFFVYLEDIEPDGRSVYVSEGQLRASHRRLAEAPYDRMGLPYHRSHAEDLVPLVPGEPVELCFDLQPTSVVFREGHRIRVTVTCADKDTFATPVLDPAPEVSVLRGPTRPSHLVLPVIPQSPA